MMTPRPRFAEALRFWLKLGCISFGGPAGQIAIMHRQLVEEKKWVGEEQFMHALNFCMLLPGPEAQQLAIYLGWLLHRTWGGIVAGVLFVLPSAVILWALSLVYVWHGDTLWLSGIFSGLKPAVIAIILAAAWRIGKKTLRNFGTWSLALGALFALRFLQVPFPWLIFLAGVVGLIFPGSFRLGKEPAEEIGLLPTEDPGLGWGRMLRVLLTCLTLWWLPVLLVGVWLGKDSTQMQMSWFFSKAAMVTFGGAYAVLPYVSQQAVDTFHWLQPGQMLDGLGLAETTPGPLIMVLQFVGFVGAWQHPGGMTPFWSATLGAALTTWVTFVPCFLWIFLGAPYVEKVRRQPRFSSALSAIAAAVVGVMANLAFWFAWHVCLPGGGRVDWFAVGLALAALIALQRFKFSVLAVVLASAAVGGLRILWGL